MNITATKGVPSNEWYKIANSYEECICPHCQTGKESLPLYPDYCPHADSLTLLETSGEPQLGIRVIGDSIKPKFECSHYRPLKEEKEMATETHETHGTHDAVNHPDHYTQGKIECIDYIQEKLTPEEFRGYIKGNVIKYLTREQHKNGDEDILKARWYLNRLADLIENKENGGTTE